jgi:hypothetical protein
MHAVHRVLMGFGRGCKAAGRAAREALHTCFQSSKTLDEPLIPRPKTPTRSQASRRYLNKKRSYFGGEEEASFIMDINPFDDDRQQRLPISSHSPSRELWSEHGGGSLSGGGAVQPLEVAGGGGGGGGGGGIGQRKTVPWEPSSYF